MLEFRKQLIEKILQSHDETEVEAIIKNAANLMLENGTNKHIIARFEMRLESDLIFVQQQPHNETVRKNLKEALRVIHKNAEELQNAG